VIVVSASLMKSGSGWYYNLTNALLAAHGGHDARSVREAWHLGALLKDDNCRIGSLRAHRLAPLLAPHAAGRRFAVKTHSTPTPALRALMRVGAARVTFNLRDPRDMVVSALDHGARQQDGEAEGRLAGLTSVDAAIDFVAGTLLPVWEAWAAMPAVLLVRYEDLLADPAGEVLRLAEHCRLSIDRPAAQRVVDEVAAGHAGFGALHFNRGTAGRHSEVLSPAEIDRCTRAFGTRLAAMGYA
jgi:hypothetical protein